LRAALAHPYRPHPLQVKICDFGLAKYSSSSLPNRGPASSSARPPANQGSSSLPSQAPATSSARTLEYSSPERLRRGRRSRQDDVFAFGIVMYFIATSRTPYSGIDSEDVERVVKNGERPEIEEWEEAEEYSPELMQGVVAPYCDLARQCWSEEPADRPAFEAIYAKLAALAASI
jgi:serine/threonine protein kinase